MVAHLEKLNRKHAAFVSLSLCFGCTKAMWLYYKKLQAHGKPPSIERTIHYFKVKILIFSFRFLENCSYSMQARN